MNWLKNAWWRFWTWVACWARPSVPKDNKPQFNAAAQDLIPFARKVANERCEQIDDPRRTKAISPETYQQMMQQQMRYFEDTPAGVYRSASFKVCFNRLDDERKAKRQAENGSKALALKVIK